MIKDKMYPNRLGIKGLLIGGRWGMERYLYTLHRLTGLGILSYFLLHIFVTASRVYGMSVWEKWMGFLESPLFMTGEYLVFAGFAFHAMNGIRLIAIEFGLAVGRPEEPVYPYKSSLNTQRPLMIISMMIVVGVIVAGAYDFFLITN